MSLQNPDDQIQLATNPDGSPVWAERKDLDTTIKPSEIDELKDNLKEQKLNANVEKIAQSVVAGIQNLMFETFRKIAPRHLKSGVDADIWMHQNGFRFVQDGLKTTVLVKNKVIREAEAKVSPDIAYQVGVAVMKILALETREATQAN